MAKKKAKKKIGKKSSRKKSTSGGLLNTNKLIGFAGAAFGQTQLKKIDFFNKLDPKMQAGAKILGGEFLQNQDFVKKSLPNDDMRRAIGDGLIYEGVKELMSSFGIAGVGRDKRKVRGNEFLAVSIEGLEDKDIDTVNEDVLADDELGDDYEIGDDIDTVNEDVLSEDDLGDDLDTVNEDVLGDDDMGDETML